MLIDYLKKTPHPIIAADISKGAFSPDMLNIWDSLAENNLTLKLIELPNENIDDLLKLFRNFCDSDNPPVFVIDYLQIIPPTKDNVKNRIVDAAKKFHPRQIQLKCLKNRKGNNYDCFFKYFSAHDCFQPCDLNDFVPEGFNEDDDFNEPPSIKKGRSK